MERLRNITVKGGSVTLTDEQRDELSIFLRCCADAVITGNRGGAMGATAWYFDIRTFPYLRDVLGGDAHWCMLLRGRGPVRDFIDREWLICGRGYEWALLEAAQRVEEGSWP